MGREIRRVPANWEHPKYTKDNSKYPDRVGTYMPLYDQHFDERFAEWLADFDRIRRGDLKKIERECYPRGLADWLCDEGQPPDPSYYRHYRDEEAVWFQVYENVSEGTPVTPPFATREELVAYLIEKGDFWQQERWRRGDTFMQPNPPGYSRAAAENFVLKDGYAPSMVVVTTAGGDTRIAEGINASALIPRQQ